MNCWMWSATPVLERREFSSLVMGPRAALLVIKWVGRYESERRSLGTLYDALAAVERDSGDEELESEGEEPTEPHFIETLKGAAADRGTASAKARYVADVAPLLIDVAGTPFLRWVLSTERETDVGTPEGRAKALERFDEELRRVRKFNGESTTPAPVADLMLELVNPLSDDSVYDPCFGFGECLVGAAHRLHATDRSAPSCARADEESFTGIFGVEINRVSYAIGLCRTLLAGIGRPRLELGNALDEMFSAEGFDCILAAPPWGTFASTRSSAASGYVFGRRYGEAVESRALRPPVSVSKPGMPKTCSCNT